MAPAPARNASTSPPAAPVNAPPPTQVQRLRLYGPSVITLAVLLPFFAYYLHEMKSAQGYLNDRAFRILDVSSHQFGSEIAGIAATIGAAELLPGQLSLRQRDQVLSPAARWLAEKGAGFPEIAQAEVQSYLDTYALDGIASARVRPAAPKIPPPAGGTNLDAPEASPLMSICCRDGNSSLRIRFLEENTVNAAGKDLQIRMDIRLDPNRMLEHTLGGEKGGMFETMFVATRNGEVVAETSSSRLAVRDLDAILANHRLRSVVEGSQNSPKDEATADATDQSRLPREVWGADQRFDVQVSGTSYVLFVSPAPFVLNGESGGETPIAFYGLTQKDTIDAQARRIPSLSLPVICITLVVGMAFLWPALKLYTMSARDRLTKFSVAAMLAITLLAAALFGAVYLSYGFFLDTSDRTDTEMRQLSERLRLNFAREISDAIHASEDVLVRLGGPGLSAATQGDRVAGCLNTTGPPEAACRPAKGSAQDQWPEDQYHLLSQSGPSLIQAYPFLAHAMLLGDKPKGEAASVREASDQPSDLRQIVKFSATRIPTPLISLPPARFDFLARLLQGHYAIQQYAGRKSTAESPTQLVIESYISPNTGEFLPTIVFNPGNPKLQGFRILTTTQLPSLVYAILPQGSNFAVVDKEGLVLFDSDPSRNLHENFFGETENPAELRMALEHMEQKYLSLRYGGHTIRAFVQPLGCDDTEEHDNCIHNLGMGLIVFQGLDQQKELLSTVGTNFLVYLLALPLLVACCALIGMSLKNALWPAAALASARRRMWPRESAKALYLLTGIWSLACFATAALIAILCRILADDFVTLPLVLPAILLLVLAVCILGLILLWRKQAFAHAPIVKQWMKRFESRIPLSAAYSLQVFAVGLAISGIPSLVIYQLAVSRAQLRYESDGYGSLAEGIQSRKLRYLSDFRRRFEDVPRETSGSWPQFCADRVDKAYDSYDWRAYSQPGLESLLRDAPLLNGFTFFDPSRHYRPLPDPCLWKQAPAAARSDPFGPAPLWNALPRPSFESSALFYLPCLLLFIGMFLWVHRIVRRLFILDFREPDPLPQLDEAACTERMRKALHPEGGQRDRILIFAHPRSGTGIAFERILGVLNQQAPPSTCNIFDFGKTAAGEIEQGKLLATRPESRIAILDNFEVRLAESQDRLKKLSFLEHLVYSYQPSVYVLSSVDPLLLMETLVREQPSEALQAEMNRWTRLLGSFERFVFHDSSRDADLASAAAVVQERCADLGIDPATAEEYVQTFKAEFRPTLFLRSCGCRVHLAELDFTGARHFEDSLVTQARNLADGYYRVIWLYCSSDERLALYQLAKDDWLNPMNQIAISHLLQKQLIHREGAYRLMNVSFRRFVLETVTARELALWQKQQNLSLWPALRMALGLALFLVALFVSYFWRDIFDVYLSYFVALGGGATAVFRIVSQLFSKDGSKLAALTGSDSSKPSGEAA